MNKLPVIAAVTNHNAASRLETLLPQLNHAGYDEVVLLDDVSIDESRDVAQRHDVTILGDSVERGPSGNRNRILEHAPSSFIHFIDAQAEPISPAVDAAERIRDVVPKHPFGYIGGLVLTETGTQHPWNYGPRQGLSTAIGSNLQFATTRIAARAPKAGNVLRHGMKPFLHEWPDSAKDPHSLPTKEVYWSMEQNLVMASDTLRSLGGFDQNLRKHGIQDLSIRMAQHSLKRYFTPDISVRLGQATAKELYKGPSMVAAEFAIARKHGFGGWLRSQD